MSNEALTPAQIYKQKQLYQTLSKHHANLQDNKRTWPAQRFTNRLTVQIADLSSLARGVSDCPAAESRGMHALGWLLCTLQEWPCSRMVKAGQAGYAIVYPP